jgi:uncharacterized membrane protein
MVDHVLYIVLVFEIRKLIAQQDQIYQKKIAELVNAVKLLSAQANEAQLQVCIKL